MAWFSLKNGDPREGKCPEHAFISCKKKIDKIHKNKNHWWIAEDRIYTAQRLLSLSPSPDIRDCIAPTSSAEVKVVSTTGFNSLVEALLAAPPRRILLRSAKAGRHPYRVV
jgi:hypothetical protein